MTGHVSRETGLTNAATRGLVGVERGDRMPVLEPQQRHDDERGFRAPLKGRASLFRYAVSYFGRTAAMRASKKRVKPCNYRAYARRRGGDSNSRYPFGHTGFRNRRIQPLCHLSD